MLYAFMQVLMHLLNCLTTASFIQNFILFIPVRNRRCFNACLSLDCAVDINDAFARDCFLSERTGKHIMVIQ